MTVQNPQQSSGQQIIQLQQPQQTPTTQTGGIQIVQQIVTPSGEIQQIPVCAFLRELVDQNKAAFISIDENLHIASDTINATATSDDSYASTRWE